MVVGVSVNPYVVFIRHRSSAGSLRGWGRGNAEFGCSPILSEHVKMFGLTKLTLRC
jgi:hypothetical protein